MEENKTSDEKTIPDFRSKILSQNTQQPQVKFEFPIDVEGTIQLSNEIPIEGLKIEIFIDQDRIIGRLFTNQLGQFHYRSANKMIPRRLPLYVNQVQYLTGVVTLYQRYSKLYYWNFQSN